MIVRSYPTLHIFSVGRYSSLPSLAVLLKSVEKKKITIKTVIHVCLGTYKVIQEVPQSRVSVSTVEILIEHLPKLTCDTSEHPNTGIFRCYKEIQDMRDWSSLSLIMKQVTHGT